VIKESSKILISNQTAIMVNPNLVKEVVSLIKIQNLIQDQIKTSIMDLQVILVLSVKMMYKTVILEINNLIRIIQKMKENHLILNHNVLLSVLQSLLKKQRANN
jgi:hypothetical protein